MEGSPVNSENTHNLDSRVSDFHRPTNSPPSVKSLILFPPIPLLVSLLILYCCWFFSFFIFHVNFFQFLLVQNQNNNNYKKKVLIFTWCYNYVLMCYNCVLITG
jgi:hypothetical protein